MTPRAGERSDRTFDCLGRTFEIHPGVFPSTDFQSTGVFTRSLPYAPGRSFLEIGCGAGVTAVTAALAGCRPAVATDISEAAARNAEANAADHGVAAVVSVRCGDLFQVIRESERFDVIYWNSNFIFAPPEHVLADDFERAFCDPGHAAHDRFLRDAPRHLEAGGVVYLGFSPQGNEQELERLCSKYGYEVTLFSSTTGQGAKAPRYDVFRLVPGSSSAVEDREGSQ